MTRIDRSAEDRDLQLLTREQALLLPPNTRLRWFYLRPILHRELARVTNDVLELMQDDNDVSLISLIGLSGIGKTTAASLIKKNLLARFNEGQARGDLPVLYVEAPANGPRSLSWRGVFQRILQAGGEFAVPSMRAARVVKGRLVCGAGRASVPELREFIETMIRRRGVRAIVIDEALHLMRFKMNDAVMDTFKSLSDIAGLKIIIIGSYDIADLMLEYGQIARRSEIVHFKPYGVPKLTGDKIQQEQPAPKAPVEGAPPSDEYEFYSALKKNLAMWPSSAVPNLLPLWWQLMDVCLGSVGLLKMLLLRLAVQQAQHSSSQITMAMLGKAGKSKKALQKLSDELDNGRETLMHACYGESRLLNDFEDLLKRLGATPPPAPAGQAVPPPTNAEGANHSESELAHA